MSEAAIVNPGTGPIDDRTLLTVAWKNVRRLRRESGLFAKVRIQRGKRSADEDGRYVFWFVEPEATGRRKKPRRVEVKVPGVPYVPSANIWDYPRLYVDGSSWAWRYAVEAVRWGFQ